MRPWFKPSSCSCLLSPGHPGVFPTWPYMERGPPVSGRRHNIPVSIINFVFSWASPLSPLVAEPDWPSHKRIQNEVPKFPKHLTSPWQYFWSLHHISCLEIKLTDCWMSSGLRVPRGVPRQARQDLSFWEACNFVGKISYKQVNRQFETPQHSPGWGQISYSPRVLGKAAGWGVRRGRLCPQDHQHLPLLPE